MKKPKIPQYKKIDILCHHCRASRAYEIDINNGTTGLAGQLYDEGWRSARGHLYCPKCAANFMKEIRRSSVKDLSKELSRRAV